MKADFRLPGTLLVSHLNIAHPGIGQEFKAKVPKLQAYALMGRLQICFTFPAEKRVREERKIFYEGGGKGKKGNPLSNLVIVCCFGGVVLLFKSFRYRQSIEVTHKIHIKIIIQPI